MPGMNGQKEAIWNLIPCIRWGIWMQLKKSLEVRNKNARRFSTFNKFKLVQRY
jgi:hypothetical protein